MPPPSLFNLSTTELRAFHFFHEKTSSQLSGFYDCEFWNTIVLQIAWRDDSVRHALIALASLHEKLETDVAVSGRHSTDDFALIQYNLAIRRHLDEVQRRNLPANVETYLAPCLIFICIEMIQGHFASVLSLVKNTLSIFEGLVASTPNSIPRSSQALLEIFETQLKRLESQAVGLVGRDAWGASNPPLITVRRSMIPEVFSSVSEARDCLEFYSHTISLAQMLSYKDSDVPADHNIQSRDDVRTYFDVFHRWSNAFDNLTTTHHHSMTDREKYAMQVLEMQRLVFSSSLDLMSRGTEIDDQMLWDKYGEIFTQAVTIAESLLETSAAPYKSAFPSRKSLFTLDVGIIGLLYDIARRYRDPVVRRRAIHLLYTYPRQEGMWDGVLAARVAERVVEIEENGLGEVRTCADVPDWARISDVCPVFGLEQRKAVLCYRRCSSADSKIRSSVQEVIEWG